MNASFITPVIVEQVSYSLINALSVHCSLEQIMHEAQLVCAKANHALVMPKSPWWRHETEAFSALLAICAENSPAPGEFPAHRPVTRSFDVFFDLRLNKRLSKQSCGWWFETPWRPLWRHRNAESKLHRSHVHNILESCVNKRSEATLSMIAYFRVRRLWPC